MVRHDGRKVRHDALSAGPKQWKSSTRASRRTVSSVMTVGEQSKVRHDGDRASRRTEQQTESQRTNFPSVMTEGYVRRDGRPLKIGFGYYWMD